MSFFGIVSGFFRQLVGTSTFDPEACIGYLLDKTDSEANRVAAAESLGHGMAQLGLNLSHVVDALYQVASDQEDLFIVREEAAGSLGFIWSQIGVDRARFERLPEDMKMSVLGSIPAGPWKAGLD
jgi:hypothetical protein